FLDDPLEHRWIALVVPRAFRIDDRDRSALADAEAVRLRAQHPALVRQAEFLQPLLQEVPRLDAARLVAALGIRLIAAQEDVPLAHGYADRLRELLLGIGGHESTIDELERILLACRHACGSHGPQRHRDAEVLGLLSLCL